ncbi:MAG: VOC family protein [Granulosicoccaceae bacterium]
MEVKRIVVNLLAAEPAVASAFYQDIFGLTLAMDQGWIQTLASAATMPVQITMASEGGSGTELPAVSIEVDNLDDVITRVNKANIGIEYGPVDEPWGVRRFYIRDPHGHLLNVLQHS